MKTNNKNYKKWKNIKKNYQKKLNNRIRKYNKLAFLFRKKKVISIFQKRKEKYGKLIPIVINKCDGRTAFIHFYFAFRLQELFFLLNIFYI